MKLLNTVFCFVNKFMEKVKGLRDRDLHCSHLILSRESKIKIWEKKISSDYFRHFWASVFVILFKLSLWTKTNDKRFHIGSFLSPIILFYFNFIPKLKTKANSAVIALLSPVFFQDQKDLRVWEMILWNCLSFVLMKGGK
jgi:hypothetical protein